MRTAHLDVNIILPTYNYYYIVLILKTCTVVDLLAIETSISIFIFSLCYKMLFLDDLGSMLIAFG